MGDYEKVLSISIAAYNVEKYIADTLNSVFSNIKDPNKIEIIIVNDGSKDRTLEKAKIYYEKYPETIVLIDKNNGGYGSTINESLKVARGKYFKLLDGDDWFSEDINNYIKILESAEEDLILTPYFRVYQGENNRCEIIDRHIAYGLNNNGTLSNQEIVSLHAAEITVRTECIKGKINITEKCFYTDVEYAYFVTAHISSIRRVPMPLYLYRIGREGQSISISSRVKNKNDSMLITEKLLFHYNNNFTKFNRLIAKAQREQIGSLFLFTWKTLFFEDDFVQSKKDLKYLDDIVKESKEVINYVLEKSFDFKIYYRFPFLYQLVRKHIHNSTK